MTTPRQDVFADIQARLRATRADTPDVAPVRIASALTQYREGLSTEAELLNNLAQLGADPLQRDRLLFSAQLDRRLEVAQFIRTALTVVFRAEGISQAQLRAALVRIGFTPESASLIVSVEALRLGVRSDEPSALTRALATTSPRP